MARDSRALLPILALLFVPAAACGQSGNWSQAGTGSVWNWGDTVNWTGGIVANGANNTATFATAGLAGPITINLDTARTIGSLVFDNPSNNFGWTIQGGNTLTLSNSGGPVIAVNNPNITATISTPLAGSFAKTGPGTLSLSGNNTSLTGGVTINAGTLSAVAGSLGTGTATLSGGTLAVGPTHTLTGASFNATNWALNGAASFQSGNILQMTPATGGAASAWFKTLVAIGPFTLNFTLADPSSAAAFAGLTVGFQNAGLNALGSSSGYGYAGVTPSAAVALKLGSGGASTSGFAVVTNGTDPHSVPFQTITGVTTANPVLFAINYDGSNITLNATQGSTNYTSPPVPLDIAGAAGSPAFFGFTAGTGGVLEQTQISNFSFSSPSFSGPATYQNPVSVTAPSTIQVTTATGAQTVAMGALTLAGTTLAVVPNASNPANQGYGLTFGGTTVTGNAAINVSNNGTGLTTLNLGALSGAGSLQVTGGPAINLTGGSLGGRLDSGASSLSMGGANLTVGSLAGSGPLRGNSASPITLTVGGDNTSSTFGGTIANGSTGALSLVKTGSGTLTLTATNTYTGGTTISDGILGVASDASLGSGSVTISPLGTLQYTATTATSRSINLGNGTLAAGQGATVTLNGMVFNGYLAGPGTFVTGASSGAKLASISARQSTAIISNNVADQFTNFTENGALTIATGPAGAVSLAGLNLPGALSSLTMNAQSRANVSDLANSGAVTINPATVTQNFSQTTLLTNVGSNPLDFPTSGRTFIGTPQTAVFPANWPDASLRGLPTFVAGIDLHGQNATVKSPMFVNNGYIEDTTNNGQGTATVIADTGGLVKGAGYYQNPVITQNGGKFQAGNSPGSVSFGHLVLGPGGVGNYVFDINNATGTAGPSPDATGNVSGWGLVKSINLGTASGNFTWTATPAARLSVALQTLLNPTTLGADARGPMDHFDPNQFYSWPAVEWSGSYAGPTDAATLGASAFFDTTGFQNPSAGTFGWSLDMAGHTLSLTYTPSAVPEPGTLALVGAAAASLAAWRRKRFVLSPRSMTGGNPAR